ncbi:AraC-type DNA-binding protein [Paenibacillus sp. UNCCL117]|uniref:AraC family transcriptional regulator n=1 Tax=unclassified Paenibacillus TaxID=185978 RepID=UPI00088FA9A9|nr:MULTISPECIES: AraC family transcriptional regulator [unclassified Paenibacillus]SDD02377.1 AraC-type DNA-binding protein [Paenibacillus sp. cl123]SFW32499.1 AraC-type DNA-binding protein [Paenibacillus sp. UNCCL117]
MRVSFDTAAELKHAIDELFKDFPVALYYGLDSVAPFPDVQSHNGIEMYYVWSGAGGYLVGNKIYPLQPGTLMLIRPNTLHKVLQTDLHQNVGRHVLIWKEQLLLGDSFIPDKHPLHTLTEDCMFVQADAEHRLKIEAIYRSIQEELTEREAGFATIVQSLVKQLLMLTYRLHLKAKEAVIDLKSMQLPKEIHYLVQYIGSNFQEPLTLERLAELVHLNPSYLSTIFRKYTGCTPHKFLTLKRVHHAKKLLRETELSIGAVAQESGFNDASHFVKVFKQHEQATPAVYRHRERAGSG